VKAAEKNARDAAKVTDLAPPTETELDAQQRVGELTVQNAMKQLSDSPDAPLAEQLPQPDVVSSRSVVAALGYSTAWRNPSRENHKNEDYKNAVAWLVDESASLYYQERWCHTHRETGIAAQIVDLLPKLVTRYPERLILREFIQLRNIYPDTMTCNLQELYRERSGYQQTLSVVLERL